MSHKVTVNSLSSNAYLLTQDRISRAADADAPDGKSSSLYLGDNLFKSVETIDASDYGNYQDASGNALTAFDGDWLKVTTADGTERVVKSTDTAVTFTLSDTATTDAEFAALDLTIDF